MAVDISATQCFPAKHFTIFAGGVYLAPTAFYTAPRPSVDATLSKQQCGPHASCLHLRCTLPPPERWRLADVYVVKRLAFINRLSAATRCCGWLMQRRKLLEDTSCCISVTSQDLPSTGRHGFHLARGAHEHYRTLEACCILPLAGAEHMPERVQHASQDKHGLGAGDDFLRVEDTALGIGCHL